MPLLDALLAAQEATSARRRPRAVLVLAGGLGDVLRWASLVPVLDAAGYGVELLIAADYPDIAALFDGAPGVDRVRRADPAEPRWQDTDEAAPALAVFAYWALGFTDRLPAGRQIGADRQRWPLIGDPGCAAAIAGELAGRRCPVPPLAPALSGVDRAPRGRLAGHPRRLQAGLAVEEVAAAMASWHGISRACCGSARRPTKTPGRLISRRRSTGRRMSRTRPQRARWPTARA